MKGLQCHELIGLEPGFLEDVAPCYGVIFLFKYPTDKPYRATDKPLDGEFDYDASERLFFAAQTIQNACGTQALLSVALNMEESEGSQTGSVDLGGTLKEFREFTMALPPEFRGEALSNSERIRDVHNSFARSSPFVDETQRQPDEDADAFHFIAYAPVNGVLYELDGLQPAPISHGACAPGEFPTKVIDVLRRRVERHGVLEITFNLLAVVRDLRELAREFGDVDMLDREVARRKEWQFENALRRHNFIGFATEVLKGVTKAKLGEGGEAYDKWIDQAKEKQKKQMEARRTQGNEDVEMGG